MWSFNSVILLISLIAVLILILIGLSLSQSNKPINKIRQIICDILGFCAIPLVINSFNDFKQNQTITLSVIACVLLVFAYIWFDVSDFTQVGKKFNKSILYVFSWICWLMAIFVSVVILVFLLYIVCMRLINLI